MAAAPAHPVVALGSLAARPDEFFTRTLLPATQLAFSMGQTTAAYAVHVSLCTVVRSAELVHKNLLGPTLNLVNPFQPSSAVEHTRFSTTRAKGSARSMLHPKSAGHRALARPVARAHARLASGALHCTMVAPSRDSFCIGSSTTLQCSLNGCGGGCSVRSDEDTWCTSLALQSSMM